MLLRWHHGFLNPRDGEREIPRSRHAVAAVIAELFGRPINPEHVSFVRCADGMVQVNLLLFGPFGVLEREAAPA